VRGVISSGSGSTRATVTSCCLDGEHWAACIMASNRGRITQREMPLCRGEGERRGWRLIGVKCMAGNPSQGLAVARCKFGELTRGELTRIDCSISLKYCSARLMKVNTLYTAVV